MPKPSGVVLSNPRLILIKQSILNIPTPVLHNNLSILFGPAKSQGICQYSGKLCYKLLILYGEMQLWYNYITKLDKNIELNIDMYKRKEYYLLNIAKVGSQLTIHIKNQETPIFLDSAYIDI